MKTHYGLLIYKMKDVIKMFVKVFWILSFSKDFSELGDMNNIQYSLENIFRIIYKNET